MKTLTAEQIAQLKADFPAEAISQNPRKPFLSTIKAYYIIIRLNEVFGVGTWQLRDEIIGTEKKTQITKEGKERTMYEVLAKATIDIPEYNIHLEQAGGGEDEVWGDSAKGAITDALNKCASYLYIGYSVFMGKSDTPKQQTFQAQPQQQVQVQRKKGINFEEFKAEVGKVNTIEALERLYHEQVEDIANDKVKNIALEILGKRKKELMQGEVIRVDENMLYNE